MEDIRDRLKYLREYLGLSQTAFGQKVGLERSSMSAIEHKQRNLTPRTIRDICREFNVNEEWLSTGQGEMFCQTEESAITLIDRIMYGENEFAKSVFKAFASLSEEEWNAVEKIIDRLLELKGKQ